MKSLAGSIVAAALAVALAWVVWVWGFCRFYVPADYMAVITAKGGDELPPGQILARKGQKGVQEDVLGEGRHFLNPIMFDHRIVPLRTIPAGKVGVVISKVGTELPQGEFLAERGQKGIWRQALGPGKYRLNPVGYTIDIVDALNIPIGYAGVVTSLSGTQAPEGQFAGRNQKGVREDILQPGLYYINPRELNVTALEIGVNQVSLLGKMGTEILTKGQLATQNRAMSELQQTLLQEKQQQRAEYLTKTPQQRGRAAVEQQRQAQQQMEPPPAPGRPRRPNVAEPATPTGTFTLDQFVTFPSKDGFEISLDMTVEFELLPRHIAWLYRSYGDLPAAVDKFIMPQILSVSRLKGSAYGARDFIVGEGREKFQADLTEALAKTLLDRRILVHGAIIRHVNVPMQILEPIQQASVAIEQDLTNKEKQNTARKMADLNTQQSLIDQQREKVTQETEKLVAEVKADQERQVAETNAAAVKLTAEIAQQTAVVTAEKVARIGKADADVIRLVKGEEARGAQLKVKAFGDPAAFNLWTLAGSLTNDFKVTILHAGDGTLWTDLDKARLGDLGGAKTIQAPPPAASKPR